MVNSENSLKTKIAVALLLSRKLSPRDIASQLRISESHVSRLRTAARKDRILSEEVIFSWPSDISDELQQEITDLAFTGYKELVKLINDRARQVNGHVPNKIWIVPSALRAHSEIEDFSTKLVEFVSELIDKSQYIAVAWGKTLWHVATAIKRSDLPKQEDKVFIPTGGQPLNSIDNKNSPSSICRILSDSYDSSKRLMLQGVPARLPKSLNAHESILRQYISMCDNYTEIFGSEDSPTGLIEKIDLFITGVGDFDTALEDPWFTELVKMEDIDVIKEYSSGNIGGLLLPKRGISTEQRALLEEIADRSFGISKAQVASCANRAANDENIPGVVVFANDIEKSNVVIDTIGMANIFILSRALAEKIRSELS